MSRGVWVKVDPDKERAREEIAQQAGDRLEAMADLLPDSGKDGGSSASRRTRPARRRSGGRQKGASASSGSKNDSSQADSTGLYSYLWKARKSMLSDLHKSFKSKRTFVDDAILYDARQMIAIADGSIVAACQFIETQVFDCLKPRYFAVEEVDLARGIWRRIYSSNTNKLPLGEDRPLSSGLWAEKLFGDRVPVCARNIDNVVQQHPDFDLFRSLGCLSYCHMPISCAPESPYLEVLTILGKKNFFNPDDLEDLGVILNFAYAYLGLAHTGLYLKDPNHLKVNAERDSVYWKEVNSGQWNARAELARQLGDRLAEMADILPHSDESRASSASQGGGGMPPSPKKASSQVKETGFDSELWETRETAFADMHEMLLDEQLPVEDSFLDSVKNMIAVADGDVAAACRTIEEQVSTLMEPRYIAVDEVDTKRRVWRRIHSSDLSKLPLSKDRPFPSRFWTENVINKHNALAANNMEDVSDRNLEYHFFKSLGCSSYCYLPLSLGAGCNLFGVLTILGKKNFLTPEKMEQLDTVRRIAWMYMGFAQTGLYLKNPDHKAPSAEQVSVTDGEGGPEGGVVSLIRERAPTLIRSSMDRSYYLQQQTEHEAMYRKFQKNPRAFSKSEMEKMKRMLAITRGDMGEACLMLEEVAKKKIRSRYFAVEEVDLENGLYRRVHSSKPEDLPVTDMRPIPDGYWAESVILNRALISSNTMYESPEQFPEYDLISSLGCQSCVYFPVSESEEHELLGILTFFDVESFFSDRIIKRIVKMREDACTYLGSVRLARNIGVADVKGRA